LTIPTIDQQPHQCSCTPIVGDYENTLTTSHAFLYAHGVFTDLGTLGGPSSTARGINYTGEIVGSSLGNSVQHAFRTAPNSPINPATDNLGPSGGPSLAFAVNASGRVVGWSSILQTGPGSFRTGVNSAINPSTDGLGTLYGDGGQAQAINTEGVVVGQAAGRAYLDAGSAMLDLNQLMLPGSDFALLQSATGINDRGQIVGDGLTIGGESHAFLLTPVPEPSSLAITVGCAGLLLLYAQGRRRSHH
jgi:probable HAF family extracellular repeat protein